MEIKDSSPLEKIIPPEICEDPFYHEILRLVKEERVDTILEIGSSSGGGSTEAFIRGLEGSPRKTMIYCLEISKTRFDALKQKYQGNDHVVCYNASSVPAEDFMTVEQVAAFYQNTPTQLNTYPLREVLRWLKNDLDYLERFDGPRHGIQWIKRENAIDHFDMVLIDGSAFTGKAELDAVLGARFILLDDINDIKNFENYKKLIDFPDYEIITENWEVRNGFAIFRKKESHLPVHFFTIVLNGLPFIKYHIDVFKRLPFRWHWHVIEGVAALNYDTGWSRRLGGGITDDIHERGLSNDGTTDYLDKIQQQYGNNITVYRKENGLFWDGKIEMINAPLAHVGEECLLWQVDADELWTVNQIRTARQMFLEHPEKTAAYYFCVYFLGEDLVISTRNTFGNFTHYEWLRTWRYRPGARWQSHEPPQLLNMDEKGQWIDVGKQDPFQHKETEERGLVFQHYAYATKDQVRFKDTYYGYRNALECWKKLNKETTFPVLVRNYLPWVNDDTMAVKSKHLGVAPIAKKNDENEWIFQHSPNPLLEKSVNTVFTRTDFDEGNVLKADMIPHGDHGKPLTGRKAKNVLVVGHERSGNHFLINTIALNFPWYSNNELSLLGDTDELAEIFDYYFSRQETRIFKSHHQFYFFAPFFKMLLQHFHVFYIVRDGRDVMTSCFHYYNRFPDTFPNYQSFNMEQFLASEPENEVYSLLQASTVAERWVQHVESWLSVRDSITVVKYEDLLDHFDKTVDQIGGVLGQQAVAKKKRPSFEDRTIYPRKGISGDWVRSFELKDWKDFDRTACHTMKKLDYYPGRGKNILWVRTDSIGDNVLASSMLQFIKTHFAKSSLTVVCQDHISELYAHSPFVDRVISFNRLAVYQDEQYRNALLEEIKKCDIHIAMNPVYSREPITDILTLAVGAEKTVGFDGDFGNAAMTSNAKERHDRIYTDLIVSDEADKPELERHQDFLENLGIRTTALTPVVWTTGADEQYAQELLTENGFEPWKTIVLFAGAQGQARWYEGFGSALSEICKGHGFSVLSLGGENEYALNQANLDAIEGKTMNLCGKTTILQAASIIGKCRLAVGTETSLAHIAAAQGVPHVVTVGGGFFGRFMPYSRHTSMVCLPLECFGCRWQCRYEKPYCIRKISPKIISVAVQEALEGTSEKARIYVQESYEKKHLVNEPDYGFSKRFGWEEEVEMIPCDPRDTRWCRPDDSLDKGADALNAEGEQRFLEGDLDGALRLFHQAIALDACHGNAHNNTGVLYWKRGEQEKAIQHFVRALEIDPSDKDTLLNCGEVFETLQRIDDASDIFTTYLKQHPGDKEVRNRLDALKQKVKLSQVKTVNEGASIFTYIEPGDLVFDVGAHVGHKADTFLQKGARVVCIEPQPYCANVLQHRFKGRSDVAVVAKGVASEPGALPFSVCSDVNVISTFSEKWKTGRFAGRQWDKNMTVPVTTLDEMINQFGVPKYCKIDVEGFEYPVLQGLSQPLPLVSFEFSIEFLDEAEKCITRLKELGYEEYNFASGEEPGFDFNDWMAPDDLLADLAGREEDKLWGDIYARHPSLLGLTRQSKGRISMVTDLPVGQTGRDIGTDGRPGISGEDLDERPVITMSTLGTNGRFANQLFQYGFMKTYGKQHGLTVETPDWIGRFLFGRNDPPISNNFPLFKEEGHDIKRAIIPGLRKPLKNVDLWGYFQYRTNYYAPNKEYWRSLFQPTTEIVSALEKPFEKLNQKGKTIVGLHLRRGDYGYECFFIAPNQWYLDWLDGFWDTLDDPVLFIASDEPDAVLNDFQKYNPVTSRDLDIQMPEADYYPDFYFLSQCHVLAISNSSFSFAAAMLNEKAKIFMRPHLPTRKLMPFDPWDSDVIFRDDSVEKYPDLIPAIGNKGHQRPGDEGVGNPEEGAQECQNQSASFRNNCVVSLGIGYRFGKGLERLDNKCRELNVPFLGFDEYPEHCPSHQEVPFAFKFYCIQEVLKRGYTNILWLDSSVIIKNNLDDIFNIMDKQGYFFIENCCSVGDYCHDQALETLHIGREESFSIPCLQGTNFGLNFRFENSRRFLQELLRLSRDNITFPGPYDNKNFMASKDKRVLGHRHDQIAMSVVSLRLGMNNWWTQGEGPWFIHDRKYVKDTASTVTDVCMAGDAMQARW